MADLIANLTSLRDAAWLRMKTMANVCADSTTIEQVHEYLEKGEKYTSYAATAADIGRTNASAAAQLRKASDGIANIRTKLSTVRDGCYDIKAAGEIADAITVLNAWSEGRSTPAEAARAFDKLFGGVARFGEKLPAPINQYALLLKQISISSFFSNMQNLMDPMGDTPRGRQLRQIMNER